MAILNNNVAGLATSLLWWMLHFKPKDADVAVLLEAGRMPLYYRKNEDSYSEWLEDVGYTKHEEFTFTCLDELAESLKSHYQIYQLATVQEEYNLRMLGDDLVSPRVYQTTVGKSGNCTSACLATIFGLDINTVPNFAVSQTDASQLVAGAIDFWDGCLDYIETLGYDVRFMEYKNEQSIPRLGLCVVSVIRDIGSRHAVVYKNGKLWHDPLPGGDGGKPVYIMLFIPITGADTAMPIYPLAGRTNDNSNS